MRRTGSVVVLAVFPALLAMASSAQAQRVLPGRFSLGVFGGVTLPSGDFKVVAGKGWHAGGLLKADIYRALDLRIDGAYTAFGSKDIQVANATSETATITTNSTMSFGTLSAVLNLGADSAAYPGDNTVSPYVLAGVGYYRFRFDDECAGSCEGFVATGSGSDYGLAFGGGATVPLAGFRTFVEARYHAVRIPTNERGRSIITVSAGIKTK
jgi:opacity protein-like surface antigen